MSWRLSTIYLMAPCENNPRSLVSGLFYISKSYLHELKFGLKIKLSELTGRLLNQQKGKTPMRRSL